LSQDRGGDAVVHLARMERAEGPEAGACFDDAMSELGLPALSPFDALMKASATVAESIAENRTHPYVGVRQLLYLLYSCHTHEWFTIDALFPFVGLDSEAEDHKFRQHFQELLDAIVDEAQVFLLASPG
jgi:hypothetical protein